MAATDAPRCQYKPDDGKQCGRPALRWLRFCDFHQHLHQRNARKTAERARQRWFESVKLHNQKSVQIALHQVMQRLLNGEMTPNRAGQLLYTLQMAIAGRHKTGRNSTPAHNPRATID